MRFLLVDDSSTMRRILVNSLRRLGYTEFVEAENGDEALERFDATVGFVITDWNMPGLSGLEFARALRAAPNGRSVPILMVTTRNARGDALDATDAGVNGFIVKPFTPQDLKEKVNEVLASVGTTAS